MFSRKNSITTLMLAFCLLASTGCQLIYTEEQEPADRAPLYFYIAVDNSFSYGLPKQGRRVRPPQEVFEGAKNALYRQLIDQGVFQEGDYIVGISPFTDEPVGSIVNYLTSGPIEIRPENLQSLSTVLLDNLEKIKLRSVQARGDYKTYYRNVLDQARSEFQKLKAIPDQQVGIILTDERGTEFEGAPELPPEKYPFYHVIKLEAKAVGNGALTLTPDERLKEVASQKDARIAEYVAAIRNQYKRLNPVSVNQLNWLSVGLVALTLFILALVWPKLAKSQGRDWRWRKQAPSLAPTFNPSNGRIYLQPERLQLPSVRDRYWLDTGGELKNPNPQGGWIEPAETLQPGHYEITVQPDKGRPVKGSFTVGKSIKSAPSIRPSYDATKRLLFLNPHNCTLPSDKDRYSLVDEEVDMEVDSIAGKIVFARPLRAGRHTIIVTLDDGTPPLKENFYADPPPKPKPQYSISIARYSDIGNPKTVELTGHEINLLDKEGMKASVWVKRDELFLYIRTTGNVRKEDGAPIIGKLQMDLGTAMNDPIRLELEDDNEDIEITVQQL